MKKRILAIFVAMLSLTMTTISCSSDDNSVENNQKVEASTLSIDFNTEKVNGFSKYKKLNVKLVELNTGKEIVEDLAEDTTKKITALKGSYQISVDGTVVLESGDEVEVAANSEIRLIDNDNKVTLNLIVKIFSEDFILEEVFFTGVKTSQGKQYASGKYFKITNNTEKVLSTGGLLIMISSINSAIKHDNYNPEVRQDAMPVNSVLYISPDIAKDVEPGDFIVVADMAFDHRKEADTAYDLSNADYEFPNTDNPALSHVDNPAVPNATVLYAKMNYNMVFMHNRGFEGYAIARFPEGMSVENWLSDYKYDYTYVFPQNGREAKNSVYKVPNNWIIDGINCGVLATWEHNPIGTAVDSGWTGVGTIDSDPDRYGKSVRRKIIGKMENGKPLFKDTNNSTEDFLQWGSEASLRNGIIH